MNAILAAAEGLRIAVLVNDFGKISLDERLIENQDGDVIALANGCMCCQIGGELYDAIDRVLGMRDRFDHLLIETSGVADPHRIAQIAVAEPELEPAGTIVLVDAVNFSATLADTRMRDTLERQVRAADLVLISKADLADADDIVEVANEPHRRRPFRACRDGRLGAAGTAAIAAGQAACPHTGPVHAETIGFHRLPFESWSWQGTCSVDRQALLAFAADEALHIFRLKGALRLRDGTSVIVHKAGSQISVEAVEALAGNSFVTAIGARPDFDQTRVASSWARLTHPGGTTQE